MTCIAPTNCQMTLADVRDELWDVLIIGAGPAGATAALHLAARGRRVLLLDRERFPRDKTCGDLLIADALHALQRAGVAEEIERVGHRLSTLSVFSPSRIEVAVPGQYVTLRRRALDAILAAKAVSQGAVFAQGLVQQLSEDCGPSPGALTDCGRSLHARLIILATGASVGLLENASAVVDRRPSAMAARCYVRSPRIVDRLVVSCDRSIIPGYAWIFPLGNDSYNVGCGVFQQARPNKYNLREVYAAFVQGFPLARELLAEAKDSTPLQGARLRCGLGRLPPHDGRPLLAIGETIGATFPFTGEGIGKAMETAELAAVMIDDALSSGDTGHIGRFGEELERQLRSKYEGYAAAQRWLRWPWLHDILARQARRSRFVQHALAGIMAETTDPRQILSWQGLLRALLS